MRARGTATPRTLIRRIAAFATLSVVFLGVACSGGNGDEPVPATPTPSAPQATPQPTAPPEPTLSASGPIVVATPRAGSLIFNDPDRDHTVSGFVLDSVSRAPIRGVTVSDSGSGARSVSDEFGFYRIDGLTPGLRTLEASGYRVEPITAEVETETWTRLDLAVEVVGDIDTRRVFTLAGTVLDRESGEPIAGVAITASGDDLDLHTTSDRYGAYELPGAPKGSYDLHASAVGYPVFRDRINLDGDRLWQVFLKADPVRISGSVTGNGPTGARLPVDASVRVTTPSNPGQSVATARVNPDGGFEIEGLSPGQYSVEAFASGYGTSRLALDVAGGDHRELDFVLAVDGSTLHVTLTSSTYGHLPVRGARLLMQGVGGTPSEGISLEMTSDTNGVATVNNLPAGYYDIWTPGPTLSAGGNSADLYPLNTTIRLGPGTTKALNSDLPAIPGDIHGFVRVGDNAGHTRIGTLLRSLTASSEERDFSAFDYTPTQLPNASITVTSARFGDRTFTPPTTEATSDHFGNYVLHLPPGTYGLSVASDGHVTTGSELTITSSPSELDFQLQRASTTVLGRVDGTMFQDLTHLVDADAPVSGARVLLRGDEGQVFPAETDSRGLFNIVGVPLTSENGSIVPTTYSIDITHPDYLPISDTVELNRAEGAVLLVQQFPTLAAGGFLNMSIAVTDKNGNKTASLGTLESIQNIRTMDVFDARYIEDSDEVEIPHVLKLRARPGEYRARICPDSPGVAGCFDHFWSSQGGTTDELDLSLICSDTPRTVKCALGGNVPARPSDHIQATGYVYSAVDGAPVTGASVTLDLDLLTEYCADECTGFIREFSKTGPTGPNGRFQLEFEVPSSNGGADLVGWSWDEADRVFNVSAPGFQSLVDTGPGQTARLFDGPQDFYLAPANRLDLLVVGSSSESEPTPGSRPDLGIPIGGVETRARVTLSPSGAELGTDSAGRVSFNTSSSVKTAIVHAPGHYPYRSDLLVPDASETGPVTPEYTLQVEKVPPPAILQSFFKIASASDGSPLKGHVLRGLSSPATDAQWSIRVDRNGVRPLRANMEDPVRSVDLVVHVLNSCAEPSSSPAAGRVLVLPGELLSGDANGVGTWGGNFDAAALPCGTLNWRVEAHTSHSIVTESFDWPLWPSQQRYPLSVFTGLSVADPVLDRNPVTGPSGTDFAFSATPGTLSINKNGDYLVYEIPGITAETRSGTSDAGKLLNEISTGGGGDRPRYIANFSVVFDGETGGLDLLSADPETSPYKVNASSLYALDSSVGPISGDSGGWSESIEASSADEAAKPIDVGLLPNPLRSALERLVLGEIEASVSGQVDTQGSWELADPPESSHDAPVIGDRHVVDGSVLAVDGVTGFDFEMSVMNHLEVAARLDARTEVEYGSVPSGGQILETSTVATGQAEVTATLWDRWLYGRRVPALTYLDRVADKPSTGIVSTVEGGSAWAGESSNPLAIASGGDGQFARGGMSRPSTTATSDENGNIFVAVVTPGPSAAGSSGTGLTVLRYEASSDAWSVTDPLVGTDESLVTDTALTVTPDGDLLLVWSEIPVAGVTPASLIHAATSSELKASRLNVTNGSWSEPELITSDNRPDFAPVIAFDSDDRVVLAWPRDMDGNLLTSDDIVVFSSEWVAGNWTVPRPVISAPGAVSELSLSVESGSAVVGVVTTTEDSGAAVRVSFNSLGRWSPANMLAAGRPGLSDVSVFMQSSGLALVTWNESTGPGIDKIVSVEATSAGVRGETVAVDSVSDLVDLELVPNQSSPVLVWVSDAGTVLAGSSFGIGGWTLPSSIRLESGESVRLRALPGTETGAVQTIHESIVEGEPALRSVVLTVR